MNTQTTKTEKNDTRPTMMLAEFLNQLATGRQPWRDEAERQMADKLGRLADEYLALRPTYHHRVAFWGWGTGWHNAIRAQPYPGKLDLFEQMHRKFIKSLGNRPDIVERAEALQKLYLEAVELSK